MPLHESPTDAGNEPSGTPAVPPDATGPEQPGRPEWVRNLLFIVGALAMAAGGISAVVMGSRFADAQTIPDLPGVGSTIVPNFLILLDSSQSMWEEPSQDANANPTLYSTDDWNPASPTAKCRSKLCIGKEVMQQLLPSYGSLVNMGAGTYAQYWTTSTSAASTSPGTMKCTYDEIAAPGERITFWIDSLQNDGDGGFNATADYDTCYWLAGTADAGRDFDSGPAIPERYAVPYHMNDGGLWQDAGIYTLSTYAPDAGFSIIGRTSLADGGIEITPDAGHKGSAYPGSPTNTSFYFTGVAVDSSTYSNLASGTYNVPTCATGTSSSPTYVNPAGLDGGAMAIFWDTGSGSATTSASGCSAGNPCMMMYVDNAVTNIETSQVSCYYSRYIFSWTAPGWEYYWKTTGGEMIGTVSETIAGVNYCPNDDGGTPPTYTTGKGFQMPDGSYVCQPVIDTADASYANGGSANSSSCYNGSGPNVDGGSITIFGRQCLLEWRTSLDAGLTSNMVFNDGRDYQQQSTTTSTYCYAPDIVDSILVSQDGGSYWDAGGPISTPAPSLYETDWCTGTNANTTPGTVTTSRAMWYYDPNKTGDGGAPYDVDWSGWDGGATSAVASGFGGGIGSISFLPLINNSVPDTNMTELQGMFETYDPVNNPDAFEVAPVGSYTPFYGLFHGVTGYLEYLASTDPNAACRQTYVLQVTDGYGVTPADYSVAQIEAEITGLQSLTATQVVGGVSTQITQDVKTYFVGFGEGVQNDPTLAAFAQAGGTAVDSNGDLDLTNGTAYNAEDSTTLNEALNAIFSQVASGYYTRSKPVLTSAGDRVYVGFFQRQANLLEWAGNLIAFNINASGAETEVWQTGGTALTGYTNINNQTTRTIYANPYGTVAGAVSCTGTISGTNGLTYFNTMDGGSNTPSTSCLTSLQTLIGKGTLSTSSAETNVIIEFVANMFNDAPFTTTGQQRSNRISDIYHSVPVLVDAPPHSAGSWGATVAEQTAYGQFQTANASREATLYVGANDGVLHAIREDEETTPQSWAGSERWGYVPVSVLPSLNNENVGHTYAVDGSFAAEDVCTPYPCSQSSDWFTMMAGTLGYGGKYVVGLNVNSPTLPSLLWEYNDGNMGLTLSTPQIGRVTVGSTPTWVVVVGGGDSSYLTTTDGGTTNLGNWVYVLNALTGQPITDSTGSAKYFLDATNITGSPWTTTPTYPGLPKNNVDSKVTIYRPGDTSFIQQAYVGDTQGRVSRLFLSNTSVVDWAPVRIFDPYDSKCEVDIFKDPQTPVEWADPSYQTTYGSPPVSLPLPWETDGGSDAGEIVNTPAAIFNRAVINIDVNGDAMFYVGTGNDQDPTTTTDTNYFYAVRDNNVESYCSATPAFVKVFAPGEKVLSTPVVVDGVVLVATYVPPVSTTGCNNAGSAKLYAFDALYGTAVQAFTQVTADGSPQQPTTVNGVTTQPGTASVITIPNEGIMSDLAFSNGQIVGVLEADPNPTNSSGAPTGTWSNPFALKPTSPTVLNWRRVQ